MNKKTPECWASDSQTQGLRIELSTEHHLMLPYTEFLLAELIGAGADHHLRLIFSMHEIIITGQNLKRVLIAAQKKDLAYIAAVTGSDFATIDGAPLIHDIVVKEKTSAENQAQTPAEY